MVGESKYQHEDDRPCSQNEQESVKMGKDASDSGMAFL